MNAAFNKALGLYGLKEIVGKLDNPKIIGFFNELGFDGKKMKDETAWCSAFVNWCCKTVGLPYSGKLNARSWLKVGTSTTNPQIGDIVVLWRESRSSWKGHVGFFVRETSRHIYILGGNQGNAVNIKAYNKNRLLEYRKLD